MDVIAHAIAKPEHGRDIVGLVDWLESVLLVEGRRRLSRSTMRKFITSAYLSDEDPDVAVDLVFNEIARRAIVCGDVYAFRSDGESLAADWTDGATAYVFMLCLSTSRPLRDDKRFAEIEEPFDVLVLDALRRHFGGRCEGVRFGSPASGDLPNTFRDRVKTLADLMGLGIGPAIARGHTGDAGLDVIVWRRFRDARSGYCTILAQCTVQIDWLAKAQRDLHADLWRGWIDFAKDPVIAIAIPFVVPPDYPKWDDARRLAHLVLDRLRICELLEGTVATAEATLRSWCEKEVAIMSRTAE